MADQRTSPGVSENFGTIPGPKNSPNSGSIVLDEHLARAELLVLEDVRDRVDRPADHAGLVEQPVDLGGVVPPRPVGDDPLELLLILAAREVGRDTCGSSASSGWPMAAQSRRKTPSALAAITIQLSSLDLKMFDGAMPVSPVPPGPRTISSRSYSGTMLSSSAKHASISETSTTCPRPPPSASRR